MTTILLGIAFFLITFGFMNYEERETAIRSCNRNHSWDKWGVYYSIGRVIKHTLIFTAIFVSGYLITGAIATNKIAFVALLAGPCFCYLQGVEPFVSFDTKQPKFINGSRY